VSFSEVAPPVSSEAIFAICDLLFAKRSSFNLRPTTARRTLCPRVVHRLELRILTIVLSGGDVTCAMTNAAATNITVAAARERDA
jgi:hypothetical protein